MPDMKVYLSTAITRGRREYVEAVQTIQQSLHDAGCDVLNERVADPNFPTADTDSEQTMREVTSWLELADALIAEATISSTGVGCEIVTVQMRGKPVLLLYDAHFGFRISDWVLHNPSELVQVSGYRDHAAIPEMVKGFVKSLG